MELKIIVVLIILLFFLFIGIYFTIMTLFINDAKNKFLKVEKTINKMKIEIWDQKLISIEQKEIKNVKNLQELKDDIFYFKKQYDLKIIEKKIFFEKQFKKWFFFNPYFFNSKINKYRITIFEHLILYLNIEFSLNEYLLEQEINSEIINSLKNQFGKYIKQFDTTKFLKIKTSNFLISEIKTIKKEIEILNVEIENTFLSIEIKKNLEELISDVDNFKNNLNFFEINFTYWILNFNKQIDYFKGSIFENKNALKNNKIYIFDEIKKLNLIKEKIINDNFQFEISFANAAIQKSEIKLISLKTKIDLNVRSYNLLMNYLKRMNNLMNKFWVSKENVNEYKNYLNISDSIIDLTKMNKLALSLESKQDNFLSLINDFGTINSEITSFELLENFIKLVALFKDNIQEMLKNQKVINAIIKSTDIVNELVAKINTTLLNSEYDLNTLPVKIKANYAMQLDNYQSELEKLMNYFQKSVKFVDNNKMILVKEILTNSIKLQQEIKRAAFIRFYNENLIIELNKFDNNSSIYLSFINLIEKAYYLGDQTEVLRLSKKLVEDLNIHE